MAHARVVMTVAMAVVALSGCTIRGIRGGATTVPPTTAPPTTTTTLAPSTTVAPTTTTTLPLPYPLPEVGECRGVTGVDIMGASVDDRPLLECDQPHGAETVLVDPGALRDLLAYPADRFAMPDATHAGVAAACQAAFDAYLGLPPLGTEGRVASRLTPVWYLPPADDWDLGARWVRCDAVVEPVPGQGGRYAGPLRGALSGGAVPASLAACFDGRGLRARCDAAHTFEAVADAVFPGAVDVPGPDEVEAARVAQCSPAAARAMGIGSMIEQPTLTTVLILPGDAAWAAGVRTGTCHVVSADGRLLNDSIRDLGAAPPPLVNPPATSTSAPPP